MQPSPLSSSQNSSFHHPKRKPHTRGSQSPPPLFPSPGSQQPAFCLHGCACSGRFRQWTVQEEAFCVRLLSFSRMRLRLSHKQRVSALHSLSRLSNVLRYGQTPLCLSIHLLLDLWLFPLFGYCVCGCCEQWWTSFLNTCFHFGEQRVPPDSEKNLQNSAIPAAFWMRGGYWYVLCLWWGL